MSCPVTAFMRLDLPTLLLPKKPMCSLSDDAVVFMVFSHLMRAESCHRCAVRLDVLLLPWVTLRFTHG
jgi:hypothetical protein